MPQIALTAEQRLLLAALTGTVQFTDEMGNVLGEFHRRNRSPQGTDIFEWPSAEECARRVRDEPLYSSEEVLETLRKMCQ